MKTTMSASRIRTANVSPTARPTKCDDDVTAAAAVKTDDVDRASESLTTNKKYNSK